MNYRESSAVKYPLKGIENLTRIRMSIFISYAREDSDFVQSLASRLEKEGEDVWYDKELLYGEKWTKKIEQKIVESKAILVVISNSSRNNNNVEDEILAAKSNKKLIIPIIVGEIIESNYPIWMRGINFLDYNADARFGKDPIPKLIKSINNPSKAGKYSNEFYGTGTTLTGLNFLNSKLIIISKGSRISKNRVGVNPGDWSSASYGLFTINPLESEDIRRRKKPVIVFPMAEVPKGVVSISDDLASQLNWENSELLEWELSSTGFEVLETEEIELELALEEQSEYARLRIMNDKDLGNSLIWLPNGIDSIGTGLEISDLTLQVKRVFPSIASSPTILRFSNKTKFSLFTPSAKSGVDIVILADCSGSMNIDDLSNSSESIFTLRKNERTITRTQALQASLNSLLNLRLDLEGRISRIALVGFTNRCNLRFPKSKNGMEQLDGSVDEEIIKDFKSAIALLQPENATTDIGQALHFAANLLYKYGHPGNEKLIVLISDGANWNPKGEDTSGEVIGGTDDPIMLMSGIHENMDISLHAIGISNTDLFNQWWSLNGIGRKKQEWMIPNHELLAELVKVGGGDPTRTGDTAVLEEYFSGLGAGVTRNITCSKSMPVPDLTDWEKGLLIRAKEELLLEEKIQQHRLQKGVIIEKILTFHSLINEKYMELSGNLFFDKTQNIGTFKQKITNSISDEQSLFEFISYVLDNLFYSIPSIRKKLENAELEQVELVVNSKKLRILFELKKSFTNGKLDELEDVFLRYVGKSSVEEGALFWGELQNKILTDILELFNTLLELFDKTRMERKKSGRKKDMGGEFRFID